MTLWIINQDLYTKDMNFIFGLAYYFQGAVLSFFRLSTKELREKEAIHEIGHVLGLHHCTNPCAMQYSNSLWQAQMKPLFLCENCRRKLNI
jgi:archaemetzincin